MPAIDADATRSVRAQITRRYVDASQLDIRVMHGVVYLRGELTHLQSHPEISLGAREGGHCPLSSRSEWNPRSDLGSDPSALNRSLSGRGISPLSNYASPCVPDRLLHSLEPRTVYLHFTNESHTCTLHGPEAAVVFHAVQDSLAQNGLSGRSAVAVGAS